MSETQKIRTPNIIIPREHQSAPKKHEAEKAIEVAAEEIISGKFVPLVDDQEHFHYGPTQLLAEHPAVKEAMAKLEKELNDKRTTQEFLEKSHMLFELNEMNNAVDQWDGQGRWIGKENEEMRKGMILSPFQFMQRLDAAGLEGRIRLGERGVLGRVGLYRKHLDLRKAEMDERHVATLQYPLGTEWMMMRFTEYGVPKNARFLGWRTALLALIQQDILSEAEAHRAFPLRPNRASAWYEEQLYIHRNKKGLPS